MIHRVPAGNKTYSDRNASEYAHTCFYRMAVSSICVLAVFIRYCILIQSRSRELQGAGPSLSAGKLIVLFSVAHNAAAGTDINKSSALTSRWIIISLYHVSYKWHNFVSKPAGCRFSKIHIKPVRLKYETKGPCISHAYIAYMFDICKTKNLQNLINCSLKSAACYCQIPMMLGC